MDALDYGCVKFIFAKLHDDALSGLDKRHQIYGHRIAIVLWQCQRKQDIYICDRGINNMLI